MSFREKSSFAPSNSSPLTAVDLRAAAQELLPAIAQDAAKRERERILPHGIVRQIAEARLLTFRVPTAYGGANSSVGEVIRFVIDLAAADSNVAQALRSSYAFVESLLLGAQTERERWFPRFVAGEVFGNAGWEIGGANGAVNARIVPDGEAYKASGSKYYSTGALYADWISTVALNERDEPVFFTVPRDREGLCLVDDFDAMGQRLTASGTTRLDNVTVHSHEIRQRAAPAGGRSPVTAFLQLYLAAVEAGIARSVLADAVTFARRHARPIVHSGAARSVDDPYVQLAVGEIASRAYAAEATVLRAAASLDECHSQLDRADLLTRVAVEVAQAQFIAAEAALRCADALFDVGGASTTARTHNLDRHWRNARTVANHNPRQWKAAVAGAYHLSGTEPPTSGLF